MDWQTLVVLLIVALAAGYVGTRWVRTLRSARRHGGGCGGGCGCTTEH